MNLKSLVRLCGLGGCLVALRAQPEAVPLPELTVNSPRVANQTPAGTFAMPVSALRYEPRVDLEGRNLAEAQADVTLRGGIFENTGFRLGAVSLGDPQTGHYFAEIPIAPTMLGAPEILTGADHALQADNSTVGAIAYGWRPIRTGGLAAIGAGQYHLDREEFYQGAVGGPAVAGQRLAGDIAWAHSRSEGSVPFGESHFDRANVRLQLAGANSQTDVFAGYQAKFFGWPNLYTPFNSDETENLETLLYGINHRTNLGHGDFVEAGVYRRRNKDDYAFNRFAPLGTLHPFQHTTWANGAALGGRSTLEDLALNYRAEIGSDELRSTSLTFGRFNTRTIAKLALVPEKSWAIDRQSQVVVKAGASYDHSDRNGGATSPIAEVAREWTSGSLRRVYVSYAETTQLPSYTALNSSATSGLFRGNPNLGRETSRNTEFGVRGEVAGWTAEAAVFYRRDDALVDWTFKRGVTARSANAVNLQTTGAELVARRSWGSCDLVLGYTALGKSSDYLGAPVDASFYALNYARQRLTAAVVARLGHGFELRFDNVARVQASNPLRTTGGDSALTSALGLAYRPIAWRGVTLTVQAENLWNSHFQEIPAVPAASRQISFGASRTW
jgi:outer membrane receptor protein involved in Fe transport